MKYTLSTSTLARAALVAVAAFSAHTAAAATATTTYTAGDLFIGFRSLEGPMLTGFEKERDRLDVMMTGRGARISDASNSPVQLSNR